MDGLNNELVLYFSQVREPSPAQSRSYEPLTPLSFGPEGGDEPLVVRFLSARPTTMASQGIKPSRFEIRECFCPCLLLKGNKRGV